MKNILPTTIAVVMIVTLLMSCVSAPPNNSGFQTLESVYDLQGTYQNVGERGTEYPTPTYLSAFIGPNDPSITHADIDVVRVRALSERTIVVSGLSKRGIEKEETFSEGGQFTISGGRIYLQRELRMAGTRAGEPIVGRAYGTMQLGLDQQGRGKYRREGAVVGLVYLFLPFAFAGSEDVRFLRLGP